VNTLSDIRVAVVKTVADYPVDPPFHPPANYPELGELCTQTDKTNHIYACVREALRLLGLDSPWFGTDHWNPFVDIVRPGDTVLIKPNLVLDRNLGSGPLEAVITHASIIRALADYVLIALKGRGKLIIGDSPQMDCDWNHLLRRTGLGVLREWLSHTAGSIQLSVCDFRKEQAALVRNVVWSRKSLRTSARSAVRVRLGRHSALGAIDSGRLYGADYDRSTTVRAHSVGGHEYVIAPEVLEADVVISVPKLKVHSKVGTTLNLKNMVGINVDKNYLPHYRIGTHADGGDECGRSSWDLRADRWMLEQFMAGNSQAGKYPYLAWRAVRSLLGKAGVAKRPMTAGGNWHGNDTAWRMTLDLNRVLLCADRSGCLREQPQRRYFSMIDGIIGGQGEGPLRPDAYASGAIFCGFNPVLVDWLATQSMGFDPERIPLYQHAVEQIKTWAPRFAPERFDLRSNDPDWQVMLSGGSKLFNFAAPVGWKGAMESSAIACGSVHA
jgi:uncharacterized protein (DUF362 family)